VKKNNDTPEQWEEFRVSIVVIIYQTCLTLNWFLRWKGGIQIIHFHFYILNSSCLLCRGKQITTFNKYMNKIMELLKLFQGFRPAGGKANDKNIMVLQIGFMRKAYKKIGF